MSRMLHDDKAPYFITIFIAAFCWTVVRTVDRLSALPLIEYSASISAQASGGSSNYTLRLRNISNDKVFSCVKVILRVPKESKFSFSISANPIPRLRGAMYVEPKVGQIAAGFAEIYLLNFSPGADLEYVFVGTGNDAIRLLAQICPAIDEVPVGTAKLKGKEEGSTKTKSDAPTHVLLIEKSLETSFIDNELAYLWSFLVLWGILMIALYAVDSHKADKNPDGE